MQIEGSPKKNESALKRYVKKMINIKEPQLTDYIENTEISQVRSISADISKYKKQLLDAEKLLNKLISRT